MNVQLPDNWLELAASHASTKWVKQFIQSYLPQLKDQAISAEAFAQTFDQELQMRLLITAAQQKNYRSNVVQALKVLAVDHRAIPLISPTAEEYRELNDAQRGKLADRQTRYFTSQQAELLVERALALLESAEWSEVGAGLAVLIGRRISEILLSEFSLKTRWSLNFSEMSKKQELASGMVIEIPTLAPAEVVLSAINRLQKALRIDDLKVECLTPKLAKQKVNQRFSEPVGAKCHQHFVDLVPSRTDRDNLYTHIFRACYATIAAHWFCPPSVPEHYFKAEIQGHFSIAADGTKLPNYSARANYDDYAIGDGKGNRDGRLGIKLGTLPGLEMIAAFCKPVSQEREEIEAMARKQKLEQAQSVPKAAVEEALEQLAALPDSHSAELPELSSLGKLSLEEAEPIAEPTDLRATRRTPKRARVAVSLDGALVKELAERFGFPVTRAKGQGYQAAVEQLLALLQDGTVVQSQPDPIPASNPIQLPENRVASWFIAEIERLREQFTTLQYERDEALQLAQQAQSLQQMTQQLKAENAQLRAQAQRFESARIALLGTDAIETRGGSNKTTEVNLSPFDALASPVRSAAAVPMRATEANAIVHASDSSSSSTVAPKRTRARSEETAARIHDIIKAMMHWNTSVEDAEQKVRISIPIIKAIASLMGANYQPLIQQVLKDRQSELDKHHADHLLGVRHNATLKNKQAILQSIARDYLAIDNWQQLTEA